MSPETKKYLIYGSGIVVVAAVGVFFYKRTQGSAATDQTSTSESELELLAAALQSNQYAAGGGGQSYLPATGQSHPPSLADEILALEQALGLAPPAAPAPTSGGSATPPVTSTTPPSTRPTGGGPSGGEPVGPIHPGGHPVLIEHTSPRYEQEADYVLEGVHVA